MSLPVLPLRLILRGGPRFCCISRMLRWFTSVWVSCMLCLELDSELLESIDTDWADF